MDHEIFWRKRAAPTPQEPFDQPPVEVSQFFRSHQEALQYIFDRRRDPDFVFVGYRTCCITQMNGEGQHIFGGNRKIALCLKCDAPQTTEEPCPPQICDP